MLSVLDKANSYDIDACSVRLIYPISFDESMSNIEDWISRLTLNNLIENQMPQSHQNSSETEKLSLVWEPRTVKVSNDFHPHIEKMISDKNQTSQTNHTLVKSYQITKVASKVLNNKNKGGLRLKLSKAAIKRLQILQDISTDENSENSLVNVPFNLGYISAKDKQGIYLHLYNLNLAVVECHVSPSRDFIKDNATVFSAMQEFVYEMTHINRLDKGKKSLRVKYVEDEDGFQDGFNMIDIIHCCLGLPNTLSYSNLNNYQNSHMFRPFNDSRFFSYVALQLGEQDTNIGRLNNNDLLRLSRYLAKRYTSHYKESKLDLSEKNYYLPFDNIAYAMSIEGGAVIVNTGKLDNDGESINHLNNFIKDTLKNVYWPLTLLTYIESLYLLSLNNTFLPRIDLQSVNETKLAELENFRSDILNFRLSYRFLQVSSLENHNTYYDKWRQIFSSEKMMHELSDDITQVNSLLSYHLEKYKNEEGARVEEENRKIEKEKSLRLSKLGIIATAALSLLGLYGTNFSVYNNDDFHLVSLETLYGFIFIVIATFIALRIHSHVMNKNQL